MFLLSLISPIRAGCTYIVCYIILLHDCICDRNKIIIYISISICTYDGTYIQVIMMYEIL